MDAINHSERAARDGSVLAALVRRPAEWALFLDIDGTLVDIAPAPDAIAIPAGLGGDLLGVMTRLGGAMALVTGRAIPYVDRLFAPHRFPLAGLHGAEMRLPDGRMHLPAITPALLRARERMRAAALDLPGTMLEDKGAALALHFRGAPQHREGVEAAMREAAALAGPGWVLQRGKMLVELKPARADKGAALKTFMEAVPFAGRRPVAVGDDLTDEDMFAAAIALGGQAIRVGEDDRGSLASDRLRSPAQLRGLLASIAG